MDIRLLDYIDNELRGAAARPENVVPHRVARTRNRHDGGSRTRPGLRPYAPTAQGCHRMPPGRPELARSTTPGFPRLSGPAKAPRTNRSSSHLLLRPEAPLNHA
jgi:hypothetical protein